MIMKNKYSKLYNKIILIITPKLPIGQFFCAIINQV